MPNRIILEVGANTVTIPLKGSNASINAAIKRYALWKGIEVEGRTATQIGEDVLRSLVKIVKSGSMDRQRLELLDVGKAALEVTVATDNDIVDDPPP